jgi:hypothetical protein
MGPAHPFIPPSSRRILFDGCIPAPAKEAQPTSVFHQTLKVIPASRIKDRTNAMAANPAIMKKENRSADRGNETISP